MLSIPNKSKSNVFFNIFIRVSKDRESGSLVFWWIRQLASLILFKQNIFHTNLDVSIQIGKIFLANSLCFRRWNSIDKDFLNLTFHDWCWPVGDLSDQVSSSVAKLITDRWKFWPHQNFHISFSNIIKLNQQIF